MDHIIIDLMQETKVKGPIRSALQKAGYDQPHQVILMEPASLFTHRTITGEYMKKAQLLPHHIVNSLLNLQAYHATKLMSLADHDYEFFLDWQKWMDVTHEDLMKFYLQSKERDARNDKWDRQHHHGKYKTNGEFNNICSTYSNNSNDNEEIEHEYNQGKPDNRKVEHESDENKDSSLHDSPTDDPPEVNTSQDTKPRASNICLEGNPQDNRGYKDTKLHGTSPVLDRAAMDITKGMYNGLMMFTTTS
jgi:hypothetical protein